MPVTYVDGLHAPLACCRILRSQILLPQRAKSVSMSFPPMATPVTRPLPGTRRMICARVVLPVVDVKMEEALLVGEGAVGVDLVAVGPSRVTVGDG